MLRRTQRCVWKKAAEKAAAAEHRMARGAEKHVLESLGADVLHEVPKSRAGETSCTCLGPGVHIMGDFLAVCVNSATLGKQQQGDLLFCEVAAITAAVRFQMKVLLDPTSFSQLQRFIFSTFGPKFKTVVANPAKYVATHLSEAIARAPFVGVDTPPSIEHMVQEECAAAPELVDRLRSTQRRFTLLGALRGSLPVADWEAPVNSDVQRVFDAYNQSVQPTPGHAWDPDRMPIYFCSPVAQGNWSFGEVSRPPLAALVAHVAHVPELADALSVAPTVAVLSFRRSALVNKCFNAGLAALDFESPALLHAYFNRTLGGLLSVTAVPVTAKALHDTIVMGAFGSNAPSVTLLDFVQDELRRSDPSILSHPTVSARYGMRPVAEMRDTSFSHVVAFALHAEDEKREDDRCTVGAGLLLVSSQAALLKHLLSQGNPWVTCWHRHDKTWAPSPAVTAFFRRTTTAGGLPQGTAVPGRFKGTAVVALLNEMRLRATTRKLRRCADGAPSRLPRGIEGLYIVDVESVADAAGWTYVLGFENGVVALRRYLFMAACFHTSILRRVQGCRSPNGDVTLHEAESEDDLRHFLTRGKKNTDSISAVLIDSGSGDEFYLASITAS